MRVIMFYHSLLSDWNHGNAHFLRGVATELLARGHEVGVYEPKNAWSVNRLLADHGVGPIRRFKAAYPGLDSVRYDLDRIDLAEVLDGADLALVHEWSDYELVKRLGQHRSRASSLRLLFHDTHHRSVTAPESMAAYDLRHYDGVLAFGSVIRDLYLRKGWSQRAWTWHEAADTRVFHPMPGVERRGDLVWIGNWGDDERAEELQTYLIQPVKELGLSARAYGVRYPESALGRLREAGIDYAGWLPNYEAPGAFAQSRVTVHIPRRPYVEALPGIPTIRVFEALACGIPLVCSPWSDEEGLFTPGQDFLIARGGEEMKRRLSSLLADREMADELAARGLRAVLDRHTCARRVDELLDIYARIKPFPFHQPAEAPPKEAQPPYDARLKDRIFRL